MDIPGMLAAQITRADAQLTLEQAVHGLDSLDEVALHPVLASGFDPDLYAVFREVPYPGQPKSLPKESERQRCDLVIAHAGATGIADTIHRAKAMQQAAGTLFEPVADTMTVQDESLVAPEDAFWLEVKVIGQYTVVDGYAGPNRRYASAFGTCRADIRKLAKAGSINRAGLAIVLFAAEQTVSEHDLTVFMHTCLDRELPVRSLSIESTPIVDRIGNACCSVGLIEVQMRHHRG